MDIELLTRSRSESNQQYAYRVLKHNILTLKLVPSQILEERLLSEVLNMSRTPIREALINLKQEYLVDIYPQKKTRVSLIDLALVQDGQFVRTTIEPFILEQLIAQQNASTFFKMRENLSAQKCAIEDENEYLHFLDLDNAFHKIMYVAINKEKIWDCISTISAQYNRMRYFDVVLGTGRLSRIYEQHLELYNIIISQNSTLADVREHITDHLTGYQSMLPQLLEDYKDYFLH